MNPYVLRVTGIKLPIGYTEEQLARGAAKKARVRPSDVRSVCLVKRSVDAREKDAVCFAVTADLTVCGKRDGERAGEAGGAEKECRFDRRFAHILTKEEREVYSPLRLKKAEDGLPGPHWDLPRPIVVGSGPAGLFAALVLAENGLSPLVVERGKPVEERAQDVARFHGSGMLDPESNVQFGEGGAGTFSDGKLHTGIKDLRCGYVLKTFAEAGAPSCILWQGKPHIGTDMLRKTVAGLRQKIIALGGEFRFGTLAEDIETEDGVLKAVLLRSRGETESVPCGGAIFAVGHSARDTFFMLHGHGLAMEKKPFAMGVRIEHKREKIDRSLYGRFAGEERLGAADYKLSCKTADGTGVYTFCMCPGGYVIPASSEEGGLAVNGMSEFARDAENSNSALLVGISPAEMGGDSPLAGIALQREWERRAFLAGGGYKAPVQLVGDYLAGRTSVSLGDVMPSCRPGFRFAMLDECLPAFMAKAIREALPILERSVEGFAAYDAVLTGIESRSSSPVRILRGESGESSVKGLFPCGEGAGYAGGIMSSAVDGIRCAEKLMRLYGIG